MNTVHKRQKKNHIYSVSKHRSEHKCFLDLDWNLCKEIIFQIIFFLSWVIRKDSKFASLPLFVNKNQWIKKWIYFGMNESTKKKYLKITHKKYGIRLWGKRPELTSIFHAETNIVCLKNLSRISHSHYLRDLRINNFIQSHTRCVC